MLDRAKSPFSFYCRFLCFCCFNQGRVSPFLLKLLFGGQDLFDAGMRYQPGIPGRAPVARDTVRKRHREDRIAKSLVDDVHIEICSSEQIKRVRDVDFFPGTRPRIGTRDGRLAFQFEIPEHQLLRGFHRAIEIQRRL